MLPGPMKTSCFPLHSKITVEKSVSGVEKCIKLSLRQVLNSKMSLGMQSWAVCEIGISASILMFDLTTPEEISCRTSLASLL